MRWIDILTRFVALSKQKTLNAEKYRSDDTKVLLMGSHCEDVGAFDPGAMRSIDSGRSRCDKRGRPLLSLEKDSSVLVALKHFFSDVYSEIGVGGRLDGQWTPALLVITGSTREREGELTILRPDERHRDR